MGVCNQFDGEDGRVVYLIGNFSQKRTVLVHEAAHATLFILNRAGVDSRDSNGEVYCYLLDSILEGLGLDD